MTAIMVLGVDQGDPVLLQRLIMQQNGEKYHKLEISKYKATYLFRRFSARAHAPNLMHQNRTLLIKQKISAAAAATTLKLSHTPHTLLLQFNQHLRLSSLLLYILNDDPSSALFPGHHERFFCSSDRHHQFDHQYYCF